MCGNGFTNKVMGECRWILRLSKLYLSMIYQILERLYMATSGGTFKPTAIALPGSLVHLLKEFIRLNQDVRCRVFPPQHHARTNRHKRVGFYTILRKSNGFIFNHII